jgi:hypothetical protein
MPNLVGFDVCKRTLDGLVADAKADLAAKKNGPVDAYDEAVTHWERKFVRFGLDARPKPGEEEAVGELVDLARSIREAVRQAQMHEIVERIDALSREIESAGAAFGQQALLNLDAAKRGRLLPVKNALDAATGAINQIKVLKKDLKADDPDEQKIATEAQALIEKFEALKASIEAL